MLKKNVRIQILKDMRIKFSVFWDVTFCRVVKIFDLFREFSRFIFLVLKKGSSSFLHNVDRFISEYTASQAEGNIFFSKYLRIFSRQINCISSH
jgi:hypothetical protein